MIEKKMVENKNTNSLDNKISRRRFMAITAASSSLSAAALAVPLPLNAAQFAAKSDPQQVRWRGIALGGLAEIRLLTNDPVRAKQVIEQCRSEIDRLENLFSLYREKSTLRKLNKEGHLEAPDTDFIQLLSISRQLAIETKGAFDVTMQPLWELYAHHFKNNKSAKNGPRPADITEALSLIGHEKIDLTPQLIRYRQKGMGISFNGIAQGYITEKISQILKNAGYDNLLIDLGEAYGLGSKGKGHAWQAGIVDPRSGPQAKRPNKPEIIKKVALDNCALATSGSYGYLFSPSGQHHHLFDPKTGRSAQNYLSVSVIAPSPTIADGLSTAFSMMSLTEIKRIIAKRERTSAYIVQQNGALTELS